MIILLLAGIYLLAASDGVWKGSDALRRRRASSRSSPSSASSTASSSPQVREAQELAERDLQAGDTLSAEFEAVSQRIGQVGAARRRPDRA